MMQNFGNKRSVQKWAQNAVPNIKLNFKKLVMLTTVSLECEKKGHRKHFNCRYICVCECLIYIYLTNSLNITLSWSLSPLSDLCIYALKDFNLQYNSSIQIIYERVH